MSNSVPPLVCNTPPPMDFGDLSNEDVTSFELTDEGIYLLTYFILS